MQTRQGAFILTDMLHDASPFKNFKNFKCFVVRGLQRPRKKLRKRPWMPRHSAIQAKTVPNQRPIAN
jgi:hypothetical protein